MVTEVKQYFTSYRSPGWDAPVNTTPQESTPIEQPELQIQPNGWVINSSANVFIDDEGLHIYDGALFLIDIAGSSILGPSGFSGSWSGFMSSGGIYNSLFGSGIQGNLAVTEVGTGNTEADYEASLSAQLPYWIVSEDDYGALSLVPDSAAASEQAVEINTNVLPNTDPTATVIFYQDVAISPGKSYLAEILFKRITTGGGRVRIEASWRDDNHDLIETPTGFGYGWYVGSGLSTTEYEPLLFQVRTEVDNPIQPSPPNAAYVRLKIGVAGIGLVGGGIRIGGIRLYDESPRAGRIILHNRSSFDDSIIPVEIYSDYGAVGFKQSDETTPTVAIGSHAGGGYIAFGSGAALATADIFIERMAADHLKLTGDARLDQDIVGRGVLRTGGQSTATGGWVKQTGFSSTPIIGIGGAYNSTRASLVMSYDGYYIVQVSARFNALAANGRHGIGIAVANNADPGAVTPDPTLTYLEGHAAAANHYVSTSFILHLSALDNVCVYTWHDSGVNKTVDQVALNIVRLGV